MKITCLQMDVLPARREENFARAAELIEKAMAMRPDVIVLPESWDLSFLPPQTADATPDPDCALVTAHIGALAKKYNVNIVAGSVSNLRGGKGYNTACIFDRQGALVATYDKTHLFSPSGESDHCEKGNALCHFTLDGARCGILICYDLRFPELTRTLCLPGLDVLFVVCQWPKARVSHMEKLATARAIENQMYVACCNACGAAGEAVCGGHSLIVDPLGEVLASGADTQALLTADCDLEALQNIRNSIPVFQDRRPELYRL